MSLFDTKQEPPTFGDEPVQTEWWENIKSFAWETIKVVIIALVIIVPVRYFLIQPFYVKGASMEPNFYDNEYLVIDEISYRFSEPQRGDIVVFRYPRDPKQFFIKRVIGLPGEQVEINNQEVKVYNAEYPDGALIDEPYLDSNAKTLGNIRAALNSDEYFVLGDNRESSLDSRKFGAIKRSAIVGKVWLRGLPLDRVQVFDTPMYDLEVSDQ